MGKVWLRGAPPSKSVARPKSGAPENMLFSIVARLEGMGTDAAAAATCGAAAPSDVDTLPLLSDTVDGATHTQTQMADEQ